MTASPTIMTRPLRTREASATSASEPDEEAGADHRLEGAEGAGRRRPAR